MPSIEKDIEVEAPVDRVYRAWTQYERFPEFMSNIKEVRRVGPDQTHWIAEVAGKTVEWDARTVEEDQQRVAWTATGESGQSGEVRFDPVGIGKTRLRVRMDYTLPSKTQEALASGLGLDERAVARDLDEFKDMIEGDRWGTP